jgi:hypothetical protein
LSLPKTPSTPNISYTPKPFFNMRLKLFSHFYNPHKYTRLEIEQDTISEVSPYDMSPNKYVLGSADPTLYNLGTFNLGIFTPGNPYNEHQYDCTPAPIFPIYNNSTHNPSNHHNPHFADHWPLGFVNEDWNQIWNGQEHKIDKYLRQARSIYDGTLLPWTHEYEYKGVPFRLMIDHQHTLDGLPIFTHGMIISFLDCNGRDNRYIINHGVYQDDLNMHIKVVCFNSEQSHFDTTSHRPPLILVAPLNHCNIRPHINSAPSMSKGPSRSPNPLIKLLHLL